MTVKFRKSNLLLGDGFYFSSVTFHTILLNGFFAFIINLYRPGTGTEWQVKKKALSRQHFGDEDYALHFFIILEHEPSLMHFVFYQPKLGRKKITHWIFTSWKL